MIVVIMIMTAAVAGSKSEQCDHFFRVKPFRNKRLLGLVVPLNGTFYFKNYKTTMQE